MTDRKPWILHPMIGFDVESTGVNPHRDRIVSSASTVVNCDPESSWHRRDDALHLINPGIEIPKQATEVHGITSERARAEGANPADAIAGIINTLVDASIEHAPPGGTHNGRKIGAPIFGMNLAYDLTMLHFEARRNKLKTLTDRCAESGLFIPVLDVYVLDKHLDPYRRTKGVGRRLGALCNVYGVKHGGEHDAMEDVLAAGRILYVIGTKSRVRRMTLVDLHNAQTKWRAEQCANLEKWFRSQKKEHPEVDPCWPICHGHGDAARDAQGGELF